MLQWGAFVGGENDFTISDPNGEIALRAIHRRDGDTDVYFVANLARRAGSASCTFAISGRQPELWDPVSGTMRDLVDFSMKDGQTTVPLEFDDSESFFIVFRKPKSASLNARGGQNFPALATVTKLPGPWTVQFDPAWGGPDEVVFKTLEDWTQRKETGIRYYSGTARYESAFDRAGRVQRRRTSLARLRHSARPRASAIEWP